MTVYDMKCPVEITIKAIGGRWKVLILWRLLLRGVQRFSELQRSLHGVTQKMLTQQLREMEKDGIIERKVYAQVPPKVEYSLTPLGESLHPLLKMMCQWGVSYMVENGGSKDIVSNCSACKNMILTEHNIDKSCKAP